MSDHNELRNKGIRIDTVKAGDFFFFPKSCLLRERPEAEEGLGSVRRNGNQRRVDGIT